MKKNEGNSLLSPVRVVGLCSIIASIVLVFFNAWFAIFPLVFFMITFLIAPFFSRWGFFLPVISKGHTGKDVVAITFDDGPDPVTTIPLLQLLEKHNMKATFFVTGEKAINNGDLIRKIIKNKHDIGNHSYRHNPLLMLSSTKSLFKEIELTQNALKKYNIIPYAFRPPVGITNPKLGPILNTLGMYCVTFSCRGFDGGNRYIHGLAGKILKKVKADDIIVLHDIQPKGKISVDLWLREIDLVLSGLKKKKLAVIALHELIGKSVMNS
jgi:peptidoglycan/xylan/chitin deacetylase (PgdA/CDA1 family)